MNSDYELKEVYMPCNDRCGTLRFTYDTDPNWNICTFEFLDSNISNNKTSFWQRLRHAWYILTKRPIYYAEIMSYPEKVEYFLTSCLNALKKGKEENEESKLG